MAFSNANILSLNSASTNITTSAYVELSASSPIPTSKLVIMNKTSSIIALGTGASGSEIGLVATGPSLQTVVDLGAVLPAGTRLALIAIDATASSGYVSVSLMP